MLPYTHPPPHPAINILPIHPHPSDTPLCHVQGGFQSQMTRQEALRILGLRSNAGESQVLEAHKRIMLANHPDKGR
jgi:hypothetical protein